MKKKILHIIFPDEFNLSFVQFINKEFDPNEHIFVSTIAPKENALNSNRNIISLYSNPKQNIIKNIWTFFICIRKSSKIILHGIPGLFYFILFPFVLKKTYWVIRGYELDNTLNPGEKKALKFIKTYLKFFVLKRVCGHISHIKGDSDMANHQFSSSAKFYYSPSYLSNVMNKYNPNNTHQTKKTKTTKILVGNSTSPTNNHSSIFKMLLPYREDDILIYCPLSYGLYDEYKDEVIREGKELFGEKFVPITTYMNLEEYNSFLEEIDIAIFNHNRQEAMGVTLTLMNMGKTIYMNCQTTSYNSFSERGFKIFDNMLIEKDGLFTMRDVSINPSLVYKEYSLERLKTSWANIFNE